jgi:uncharacterized protein
MKALILSDIHGSASATAKALTYFESYHCDYLFLLGDLLYHGPRNALPLGHDTMEVVELLNPLAEKIIAVRGNCDSEMDQTLLSFSCMADYTPVLDQPYRLFLTHGHLWEPSIFPKNKTDAILSGHTHRPSLQLNVNGVLCFNPGSISLPRGEYAPTFGFYNHGKFSIHLLEQGEEIAKLALA